MYIHVHQLFVYVIHVYFVLSYQTVMLKHLYNKSHLVMADLLPMTPLDHLPDLVTNRNHLRYSMYTGSDMDDILV